MNTVWSKRGWKAWALSPVSVLFFLLSACRRTLYKLGLLKRNEFGVPLIVVGNISVGGTGKTPMVAALVSRLKKAGFNPGIVSRGYGAQKAIEPRFVDLHTPVALAGDEPALLARETAVPVVICANRSLAVQALVDKTNIDVVLSDDGLQHYAMSRDKEIAVIDGTRGLGNGFLLPAGPLRETASRLTSVDLVAIQKPAEAGDGGLNQALKLTQIKGLDRASIANGTFCLRIKQIKRLGDNQVIQLSELKGQQVHAVAGLGNPTRFFDSLNQLDIDTINHAMPDHHHYRETDLRFDDELPIVMTSKDAVKVRELDIDMMSVFEVCVEPELDSSLQDALDQLIADLPSKAERNQ